MKALIVRSSFMLLVLLCSVVPAQQATESPAMQKEIENLLGRVHEVVSLYEIDGKEELRCHLVVLNQKEPNVLELQDVSSVPGFTPVVPVVEKQGEEVDLDNLEWVVHQAGFIKDQIIQDHGDGSMKEPVFKIVNPKGESYHYIPPMTGNPDLAKGILHVGPNKECFYATAIYENKGDQGYVMYPMRMPTRDAFDEIHNITKEADYPKEFLDDAMDKGHPVEFIYKQDTLVSTHPYLKGAHVVHYTPGFQKGETYESRSAERLAARPRPHIRINHTNYGRHDTSGGVVHHGHWRHSSSGGTMHHGDWHSSTF